MAAEGLSMPIDGQRFMALWGLYTSGEGGIGASVYYSKPSGGSSGSKHLPKSMGEHIWSISI